jgi:hypothetical protein
MVLGFLEGKEAALFPCMRLLKAAKPLARLFLRRPPVTGLFLKDMGGGPCGRLI